MKAITLDRRTVLRGLGGAALSLPLLEAMLPRGRTCFAATAARRYLVCFSGQGLARDSGPAQFLPTKVGSGYDLRLGTMPLAAVKDEITIVSDMRVPMVSNGVVPPAGAGDAGLHDGSMSPLLSGVRARNANGRCQGITSDQIVAEAIGKATTFPSLAYRIQAAVYAETFFNNRDGVSKGQMSYKLDAGGRVVGVAPVASPRLAFQSLFMGFGSAMPAEEAQRRVLLGQRKSVLDLVQVRTRALLNRVGGSDRARIGQHLQEVRDLERRIEALGPQVTATCRALPDPGADPAIGGTRPDERPMSGYSINNGYSNEEERARVFCDLLVTAFACDLTRSASLMFTMAQCYLNAYPLLGYKSDFHNLSHFFSDDKPISDGLAWHMKHFGYLVGKLRDTKEGNASLLDNAAVVFLFESGAKSAHSTDKMACLLAGRAGGLQPGRHVVATGAHPGQVVLSAMNAVGVPGNTFGEVSGALPALFGK